MKSSVKPTAVLAAMNFSLTPSSTNMRSFVKSVVSIKTFEDNYVLWYRSFILYYRVDTDSVRLHQKVDVHSGILQWNR